MSTVATRWHQHTLLLPSKGWGKPRGLGVFALCTCLRAYLNPQHLPDQESKKWFLFGWKDPLGFVLLYLGWHYSLIHSLIKIIPSGLPWWRSGWESACQCRGHGFDPWSGRIPHAAEQLGPWATTTEPARLEPVLCNKRGRDSERPAHCDEEWLLLAATRESPHTETKTQHNQKLIN